MARFATGPRPFLAAAVGAVVGVGLVVGLAALGWPDQDDGSDSEPLSPAAAASAFLERWERSRLGTWAVDARFDRVTTAGRRLTIDVHMAQRPPDRLIAGLGAIDARRGGQRLACAPDADGNVHCRPGGPARPYEDVVADEMRLLATYVRGPGAFYAVRAEGRCFDLRLRLEVLSPPYGEQARFCFDGDTGAPVRTEIVRVEARDRTVAVSVRARPTDDDLNPEKWRAEHQTEMERRGPRLKGARRSAGPSDLLLEGLPDPPPFLCGVAGERRTSSLVPAYDHLE